MFKPPSFSSDIIAFNFDGLASPSISITLPKSQESHSLSRGWGLGWYPEDNQSAMVTKDTSAYDTQILMGAIIEWANFRSTSFFCKILSAKEGYSHAETQPFSRSFAGRDWLFTHNGYLDKRELEKLHADKSRFLEPLGQTDSELAFCNLLAKVAESSARKISDIDPQILHSWFQRFDALGSSDMYFTDGSSMVFFQGSQSPKQLRYSRIQPPKNQDLYTADVAKIKLTDPRDTYRTAFVMSSAPFSTGDWTLMYPGQMLIVRQGAIVWDSVAASGTPGMPKPMLAPITQPAAPIMSHGTTSQNHVLNIRAMTQTSSGEALHYRLFEVTHSTEYSYSQAVEHSTHLFRLQPTDDPIQEVEYATLSISSPTEEILFEDVFGNQAIHCVIDQPYKKLSVKAVSRVKVFAAPPDDHSLSRRQTSIPLVWMPWQRQMMMPYLLPSELPESQLTELTEYAMSFVLRNDYHLVKIIEDMTISIYRDYKYVSGSTSLSTTPFEVYTSRQGVCQDFANLLICLARLLSIPARYRMGYIYTGVDYANKIQSDASHAWAEVYLPYVGWRGFDPTNGCSVSQDHVRVACGRNYIDATPTSGTIYRGGGKETLKVDVKMREILR